MAKKKINGLPVFEARMTSENCGVLRVSFVDAPAVESDFVAYAKEEKRQDYKITDEEKQRVFGCVLRADYPIYRRDEEAGEYYIIFRADEIRAFAQKYLAEGRQNEVDLEHDFKSIEGAEMVQYFIKDTEGGVAPAGFEDVADGSLFAEYQITDADLWERIKSGEFHGFSVEIVHAVLPAEYHSNKIKDMKNTILAKVKEALAKAVADVEAEMKEAYGTISSDKGSIFWDGEDAIAEGVAVWGEDAEGNKIDLEDGEYVCEGDIIVIADGKVSEIKPKQQEEEKPAEGKPEEKADTEKKDAFAAKVAKYSESYNEKARKIFNAVAVKRGSTNFWLYEAGDDYAVIGVWGVDNEEFLRYSIAWEGENAVATSDGEKGHIGFIADAPAEGNGEAEAQMSAIKADYEAQIAAKDAEIADLKGKLEAPAGESAHDAFKKATKVAYSGNNPLEEAKKYLK